MEIRAATEENCDERAPLEKMINLQCTVNFICKYRVNQLENTNHYFTAKMPFYRISEDAVKNCKSLRDDSQDHVKIM